MEQKNESKKEVLICNWDSTGWKYNGGRGKRKIKENFFLIGKKKKKKKHLKAETKLKKDEKEGPFVLRKGNKRLSNQWDWHPTCPESLRTRTPKTPMAMGLFSAPTTPHDCASFSLYLHTHP